MKTTRPTGIYPMSGLPTSPGGGINKNDTRTITPQLLAALVEGDHQAFQKVYLLTLDPMLNFLNLLLHSRDESEELAQEIFVALWEHRGRIDPNGNFKGYLYKITKSAALKKIAHRKVEEKYRDFITNISHDFTHSPDDLVSSKELALLIKISLEHMPEKQRRVFEMSRFEGKSNDEIAKELGISPNTVRVHIHTVLNKIKSLIAIFTLLFIS